MRDDEYVEEGGICRRKEKKKKIMKVNVGEDYEGRRRRF